MSLWWLGALIYVLGSIIINFGSNLIRFDHERQARKKEAWEKKRDLGNKVPNNDEAVEVSGNPKDIEMDVVVDPAPSPRAENHELEVDVDVDVDIEQGPSPAFVKPPFPRLGKLASPSLARSSSGLLRNQDSEDPVKIDLPSGNQMSSKKGLEKGVSPSSSPAVSDVTVEETATTTTTTTKTSSTTKVEQYNMPSVLGRPLWVFGFSIFVVGNILNWVAFMFTAQSLCAALGSVQFVSNLIFANLINKEKITLRAILSTVLIVTGNIVIVIFGSKSSANWDAEQLIEGLKNHTFIAYLMFATALVILMQATYWGCLAHLKRPPHPDDPSFTMSFRRAFPNSLAKRLVPFTYAAVSAIIGVNSVLLGKMSAGLIMAGIVEGIDQGPIVGLKSIFHISTFVIIILFLGIIAFWIYRMNTALKRYSAIFIIPVLQVIWLVFGVLEGGIFFDEFSALSPLSQFFFALGIFILLVGLIILSPRPPTASAAAPIETEQEIIDLEAELGPIEVPGLQKQEQVNVEVEPEFYEERNFDRPSPSKVHPPSSSTSSSSSSSSYPKDQHSRSQNQVGSYDGYMEHDLSVDLDLDPIPRGRTFSTSPYTTSFHDGPSPPHSPPHHQSSSSSHLPSHQYEYQDQDAPVSEDHYNDRDHPLSDDQSYNPHLYGNERGDGNLHYDDAPHFQPPPTNEWNDQGHEVQFHDVDEDATTSHPFFDTSRFENAREAVVSERSPPHPSGQEQEHEPSIPVHDEFYGGNPTHNDSSYFDSNPERVDLDSLSSDWPSEPSFPTFPSSSSSQLPSESFDHSYSPAPLPSSYALAFEPSQEDQLGAIPLGNASNDPNEDHVDFEDDLSTPGLNTWETSADLPNFSDFSTLDLQTPEDDDEGW